MHRNLNNTGFTLIELMLAMVLFSTVLVISTVGFIGMNRTFSRGTIKKQLSQDVQTVITDATRTLRAMPVAGDLVFCDGTDPTTCSTDSFVQGWQTYSFGSACYMWPATNASDRGGLYKLPGKCNSNKEKTELLNPRYMVRSLIITPAGVNIYTIKGVFSTLDDDAISFNATTGEVESCKGTAESSAVATCAVQKFEFSINRQGETL